MNFRFPIECPRNFHMGRWDNFIQRLKSVQRVLPSLIEIMSRRALYVAADTRLACPLHS